MALRKFGFLFLAAMISVHCFGQRIVDQTFIDDEAEVFLFDTMSLEGFVNPLGIGSQFPHFQTISTQNEVFEFTDILQTSIEESKVPIFVFGRPSCNFMRAAYKNLVLPMIDQRGFELAVFHLANSVEAHATNGYPSPYYVEENGQLISGDITISDNIGFEFLQPYTGQELKSLTNDFVSKMVELEVGTETEFGSVTILLDNPEGGFTQAFSGPPVLWVLNPFDGSVLYESTDFSCYTDPVNGCETELAEFVAAIDNAKALFPLVGIENPLAPELQELENFGILGQPSNNGVRIFFDPVLGRKYIRFAQ